jgi:hypothetical protein
MFIGHFAAALAAKRVQPGGSLGTYVAAAQLPDLLWPFLLLAGVEQVTIAPGHTAFTPLRFDSYPVSHSLLTVAAWGVAFGAVELARAKGRGVAMATGLLVASHWILDAAAHAPDMPLLPGSPVKIGFGLWNSVPATLLVEGTLFAGAVWVYLSATRPRDGIGRHALAGLVVTLVAVYLGAAFGPPPPNVRALALSALGVILFVAWAAWVDRHREAIRGARPRI